MIKKIKHNLKEGKNFIKFAIIKLFSQFFGLLLLLILAKFLNPAGFGVYALSFMIISFFLALLINSSQTPFIIYANQERNKTGRINKSFSTQLIFFGISLVLFVSIILLFDGPISEFAKISKISLIFIVLAFLGISITSLVSNIFLALDRKNESSVVILINSILMLLFVFIFYLFNMLSLNSLFLTYFISGVLVLLIFAKRIDSKLIFPLNLNKKSFSEQWKFTKWQIFGFVALYLIGWGDNFVLRYFVSIDQIGVYNLAYKLFSGFLGITFIVNLYFLPFISQNIKNRELIRDFLKRKRWIIFIPGVIFILSLAIFSPILIDYFYGQQYHQAIFVFLILLISLVLSFYYSFYNIIFNVLEKFRFLQITNIIQIIINLCLDILFVPIFGILGAAFATVIGYLIRTILIEIYYQTKIKKLLF